MPGTCVALGTAPAHTPCCRWPAAPDIGAARGGGGCAVAAGRSGCGGGGGGRAVAVGAGGGGWARDEASTGAAAWTPHGVAWHVRPASLTTLTPGICCGVAAAAAAVPADPLGDAALPSLRSARRARVSSPPLRAEAEPDWPADCGTGSLPA